jgi:Fe-Mn family superoxide dismutase
MYNFIKYVTEGRKERLEQVTLPYDRNDLGNSLSKDTLDLHYGKLYKAYVDRYNKGEGDDDFNEAGAFLHAIYFTQFRSLTSNNQPTEQSLEFVEQHFKSFENFKKEFLKTAMGIQGAGWVYLARNGELKTIKNHEIRKDIVLLIDWWEHSFLIDFGSDKEKYLEGQWRIIDWTKINYLLTGMSK